LLRLLTAFGHWFSGAFFALPNDHIASMSALGQKRTSGHIGLMSALPPKADIAERNRDVCFVPKADIWRRSNLRRYSITSSARDSKLSDILMPSARAASY
jgi:hypothetical protein